VSKNYSSSFTTALVLFTAAHLFADGQINEKELIAEWYRGDNLGYNVTLTLSADHKFKAVWFGDEIREDGKPADYGSAQGTWRLEGNQMLIRPDGETGETRGDLGDLELRSVKGRPQLWPKSYPRIAREFHFTSPMVFKRRQDIDAEDREIEVPPEQDRGPITRTLVLDDSFTKQLHLESHRPRAKFTVPKGWCISDNLEDSSIVERDSWFIVPESENYKGLSSEHEIDIDIEPLLEKDPRTPGEYAKAEVASRKPNETDYKLLGPIGSISTEHLGRVPIFHFELQNSGPQWRTFILGKRAVVEVRLSAHRGSEPGHYRDALEAIVKSVVLKDD
jgi:hypothetical protein